MWTFVVKSSLNVTVFVIKNAPDNLQFLHVIRANNLFCPLANIDATLPSTLFIAIRQMAAAKVHAKHTPFKALCYAVI